MSDAISEAVERIRLAVADLIRAELQAAEQRGAEAERKRILDYIGGLLDGYGLMGMRGQSLLSDLIETIRSSTDTSKAITWTEKR